MFRKTVYGIILILFLVSMLTLIFDIQPAKPESFTIIVPDDYPTIQEAINNANEGDKIIVCEGLYAEGQINVNKSLTLIALERVEVDGLLEECVFNVTGNNVTISGFTVLNSSRRGIFLRSSYNSVQNNIVTNNTNSGIHLFDSHHNIIERNVVVNNFHGFDLSHSSYNLLRWNDVTDNEVGMFMSHSDENIIESNTIADRVVYGSGIILRDYSRNNKVIKNNVLNNKIGIKQSCYRINFFYHNNLINNTSQISTDVQPGIWDNGCEGNYWNDYNGTDLDGDGVGDTELPWQDVDNYPLMSPYMKGDVNHDGVVDISDVVLVTAIYDSKQGDNNWNCHSDIAEPYGIIDMSDVVVVIANYRKEWSYP